MTDSRPARVGIVLPDAATPVLFRRALQSITSQSFGDWRLVVMEADGGTGETRRLASEILGAPDPRIEFLPPIEGEVAAGAINRGLEALGTELAIIHAECDTWAPEFLRVMTQTYDHMSAMLPGLKGAASGVAAVDESVTGGHIRIDAVRDWHPPGALADQTDGVLDIRRIVVGNPFPAIAFLFDRHVAVDLGMYDPTLPILAEWDFHQRFCLKNDVWIHAERLAFHHAEADRTDPLQVAAYGALLTNRWVRREGRAGLGTLQILQVLATPQAPSVAAASPGSAGAAVGAPTKSPTRKVKRKRGPVGEALSRLNRYRKRWI